MIALLGAVAILIVLAVVVALIAYRAPVRPDLAQIDLELDDAAAGSALGRVWDLEP